MYVMIYIYVCVCHMHCVLMCCAWFSEVPCFEEPVRYSPAGLPAFDFHSMIYR